jgi:hypothetical protein
MPERLLNVLGILYAVHYLYVSYFELYRLVRKTRRRVKTWRSAILGALRIGGEIAIRLVVPVAVCLIFYGPLHLAGGA